MGIFEKMQKMTSGKQEEPEESIKESNSAKIGDTIKGVITNIVISPDNKKGGYGFILSEQLPFERIFFHWTGLKQDTLRFPELKKRMKVEFKLQRDEQNTGYVAIKIKVLGK